VFCGPLFPLCVVGRGFDVSGLGRVSGMGVARRLFEVIFAVAGDIN
jgi:hypothetical protein